MNYSDDLKGAETAEGDEGNSFIALFAPDGDDLWDEEQGIAEQA